MKFCSHFIGCAATLALSVPLWADAPTTAAPSQTAAASLTDQPVLDTLIGKRQVIGLTLRGGSRSLGRVLSADHGLYVVQTFHYVSAPMTTPVSEPRTTLVTGRNRRRSQVTKWVTTRVTTQNVIADDVAVQALLSGVTGASYRPREEAGPREMVAPADVLCIQELSPPPTAKAAAPSASSGWTMKTLWASPDLPAPKAGAAKATAK